MTIHKICQQKKIKHDSNIKNGIFYCPTCEVVMSSYYLRTFSNYCLRNVNYGRCTKCSKKPLTLTPENRLDNNNICTICNTRNQNNWKKLCFTPLRSMSLNEFKMFCLRAMKMQKYEFAISEATVEHLFQELSARDFVSANKKDEAGLSYQEIIWEMKKAIKKAQFKKDSIAVSG